MNALLISGTGSGVGKTTTVLAINRPAYLFAHSFLEKALAPQHLARIAS